ncbi:MAG TPA: META domain-containing protein [Verrucomicrobiae bacterium]|nr:META domain-containing protein [Verrucomicrobiae bacterium]
MMRNRFVLSCAVAALLFAACKAKSTPPTGEHPGAVKAPPDSSFGEKPSTTTGQPSAASTTPAGVDWLLASIEGVPVGQLGAQAVMRLDPKTSEATGKAVCNQFRGHFELDDAGLRFGPLATTRMACKGGSADLESKYLKALQETSRWSRNGETLTLSDAGGKPLLEFLAKAGD